MSSFPNEWYCPITLQLMTDPVIGPDGQTYERSAIEDWLRTNTISPITRQPMTSTTLIANIALRNTIQAAQSTTAQPSLSPRPKFNPVLPTSSVHYYEDAAGRKYMHTKLVPPTDGTRQPITFIAIIDTSGSMGEPASNNDAEAASGFTRLDLVKHSLRTIIKMLEAQDSFAIVTFSTAAKVMYHPALMTSDNKRNAESVLDRIYPDSQTNIWDGIRISASLANLPELTGQNIVAMLLTDGYPNVNPPRGILESLHTLTLKNSWTLHTFGFGYNLDSLLLEQIAKWGNGMFGFIPDCSMVGTVFINFLANMLSTAAICNGRQIMYGQAYDSIQPVFETDNIVFSSLPEFEDARYKYLQVISSAIQECKNGNISGAKSQLQSFADSLHSTTNDSVKSLLRDIVSNIEGEGQIGTAPDYFTKWGEHYMRSYLRAQQLQLCMNFKDPGLQIYGGTLFKTIQAAAETIFCNLPAPTPSGRRAGTVSSFSPATFTLPTDMSAFYNTSGGCFHGENYIKLANGMLCKIKNCSAGMRVATPHGVAKIIAVVVCNSYAKYTAMTQVNRLLITPWHPIKLEGSQKWIFPDNVGHTENRLISTVYNFVLDKHHTVIVEDYHCITLGHGICDDPVAAHDYFGTEKVIDDLKKQKGWNVGRPTYLNHTAVRCQKSGMIIGWQDKP